MDTLKIRIAAKRPKRTTEELIEAAKLKDAQMDRSRKTPTKEQKATALLNAMLNYEDTAKSAEDEIEVETPKGEWDVKIGDPIEFFDPTLSYEITGYRPITKDQGLDFNPKLFTEAADSFRKNKRYTMYAPGTFKNKLFWTLEWDRCCNGCTIGKYRLTGLNYFWLNYYRLLSSISLEDSEELRSEDFPGFINKLYEYFHYLELVKVLKKDGLAFKARGVGASEIAASNAAHMYTFHKASISVVTAFLEDYVRTTLGKVWLLLNFLNLYTDGEFRHVRMKLDTDMHKRASKVDRDKNESGWMAEIKGITHDSPRKLRGERVNAIYFEEAGSDPVLEKTYILAEALIRTGGKRVGSRYAFGTGGDAGPALAALNKMFYNPKGFKILPYKNTYGLDGQIQYTGFFIPAYSMWFGDDEGNVGFDERGVVNEEMAKQHFIKMFEAIEDSHSLLITRAEFCFTPEDAFILEGSNRFDQELLVELYNNITIHKTIPGPLSARLSWNVNTESGGLDKQLRPKIEFISDGPLKIIELPKLDPEGHVYLNLYCIGIDSIDADSTTSTGLTDVSKFCAIVYRRAFGIESPKPVAVYIERPTHILTAYENAMKLCSFYNAKALIEATRISIVLYFLKEHMTHYLMKRPLATANSSKKTNFRLYGVPTPEAVILHYLDLIELYIVDYSIEIQFPDMLNEFIKYSYENKRKFDMVAAFGMALLADEDMIGKVARPSYISKDNFINLSYYRNEYGQLEFGVPEQSSSRTESLTDDLWSLW